jgi:hypothetical protein
MDKSMIKYEKRARQLLNFQGLCNKKIHPTDVDFALEVNNQYLILGEVKLEGVKFTKGQEIMLERMADRWGHGSVILYVRHNTPVEEQVHLRECLVEKYYYAREWKVPKIPTTVGNAIEAFAQAWDVDKLKGLT